MSRSGYSEDYEPLALGRWRAQVKSATRGKRGQQFFRDLVAALDALPEKKLAPDSLETPDGEVCALGALGRYRSVNLKALDVGAADPDDGWEDCDWDALAKAFDVAPQLTQEVMYMNDEGRASSAEERWQEVRDWAARQIRQDGAS